MEPFILQVQHPLLAGVHADVLDADAAPDHVAGLGVQGHELKQAGPPQVPLVVASGADEGLALLVDLRMAARPVQDVDAAGCQVRLPEEFRVRPIGLAALAAQGPHDPLVDDQLQVLGQRRHRPEHRRQPPQGLRRIGGPDAHDHDVVFHGLGQDLGGLRQVERIKGDNVGLEADAAADLGGRRRPVILVDRHVLDVFDFNLNVRLEGDDVVDVPVEDPQAGVQCGRQAGIFRRRQDDQARLHAQGVAQGRDVLRGQAEVLQPHLAGRHVDDANGQLFAADGAGRLDADLIRMGPDDGPYAAFLRFADLGGVQGGQPLDDSRKHLGRRPGDVAAVGHLAADAQPHLAAVRPDEVPHRRRPVPDRVVHDLLDLGQGVPLDLRVQVGLEGQVVQAHEEDVATHGGDGARRRRRGQVARPSTAISPSPNGPE